jgi:hypothetical protein
MKILLVNEVGQTVVQLNDVEKFDGSLAGHAAGLLDMLDALIATARPSTGGAARLADPFTAVARNCETLS